MLTATRLDAGPVPVQPRRVRSLPSLQQQYRAYLMQRIEDYKDSLSRGELMRLGDEAARDLQGGTSGQLVLTEVLMQETVDQQIIARLNLPSFRKWRAKILPLREAQRSPNRWGISVSDPVGVVLPLIEPGDRALIIGAGADRAAYLLAAHDLEIQCLFGDSACATRVEGTMASESLTGNFEAFVVALGGPWLPPAVSGPYHLVVIDAAALLGLPPERQRALVIQAQQRTAPEGLHAIVSAESESSPEGCLHHYQDWPRIQPPKLPTSAAGRTDGPGLRGVLLSGPPIPASSLTSRPSGPGRSRG